MRDGLATLPNTFQRLMLQWEQLAPYNAGQYATLCAPMPSLTGAWREAVVGLGLQQIGQHPDAAVDVAGTDVEAHVTASLNRPFAADDSPLRPFVCDAGEGRRHAGIIYRHAVADSASIRLVMRAWIERALTRGPAGPSFRPVRLARGAGVARGDARQWSVAREVIGELSRASRTKRVRRLPPSADPRGPVAWRRYALPDRTPARLLGYARRHGVRVNDLFVAAAALACDSLMPDEDTAARSDIGIGTIADVRRADRPPDRHFGVSLGFIQTFWRWQDLRAWPFTLAAAAAQSRVARERHLAEASVMRLWAASHLGASMDADAMADFYRKRCPLSAGVSNVNLTRAWPAAIHPAPLAGYTRVSPLGPMLPLVFTPTTLGQTLHLGVTHRTNVVDPARCDAIVRAFIERLDTLG